MFLLKHFTPLLPLPRSFHSSGVQRISKYLPSAWDIMTSWERWEACQHAKGNKDPWMEHPVIQGPGTKDCPNVVPSVYNKRIVLCSCPEQRGLVGFYLHEGFPRRCACNRWFVLERLPFPKVYDDVPECIPA